MVFVGKNTNVHVGVMKGD